MIKFLKILLSTIVIVMVIGVIAVAVFISRVDINSYKPLIIEKVNEISGGELSIDGKIELKLSLHPFLEVNDVSFRNPAFRSHPEVAKVQKASISISVLPLLFKTINIREFSLINPEISLVKNQQGQANWDFVAKKVENKRMVKIKSNPQEVSKNSSSSSSSAMAGYSIELGQISGDNINLTYQDYMKSQYYQLEIPSIQVKPNNQTVEFKVGAIYNKIPITIQGTTSRIMDIIKLGSTELDIMAMAVGSKIKITGKTDIDFKDFDFIVKADASDVHTISELVGETLPITGKLDFDSKVYGNMDNFKLIIDNLNIGKSGIYGDVNVSVKPTIKLGFNLHSMLIDTLELMIDDANKNTSAKTAQTVAKYSKNTSNTNVFSDKLLPFAFLDTGAIKGALSVDKLVWGTKEMPVSSSLKATMDMNNSILKTNISSMTGEGKANAYLTLQAFDNNKASLKVIANTEIPTAEVFFPQEKYLQRIPIKLDIKASSYGSSVAQLMGGMNGNIYLNMGAGTVKKDVISWLGGDILMQTISIALPNLNKNKTVDFKCGAANIDITNGIVNLNRTFAIETDKFNLSSGGNVNLDNEALSVKVNLSSLKGLNVGVADIISTLVEVKGTLGHPEIGMGAKQLVDTAVRVGAAILTSGLSIAGEKAVNVMTEDTTPCQTAWNKGVIKNSSKPQTVNPQAVNSQVKKLQDKVSNDVKEAFKGLKNIF